MEPRDEDGGKLDWVEMMAEEEAKQVLKELEEFDNLMPLEELTAEEIEVQLEGPMEQWDASQERESQP